MNKEQKELCGKISRNMMAIRKSLSSASLYELLAEECSELAQMAQKKARKLRGENYTPMPMDEIDKKLIEEISDVELCRMVLLLNPDLDIVDKKLNRWIDRIINEKFKTYKGVNNE